MRAEGSLRVRRFTVNTFERVRLDAELSEVMVCVKVRPPEPLRRRHPAEDRMVGPAPARGLADDRIQQPVDLGDVGGEIARARAGDLLIDLRSRHDPRPPLERRVEREPFDHRLFDQSGVVADGLLAESHAARVGDVTHHLLDGHPTPATFALRREVFESSQEFSSALRLGQ